MQVEFPITGVKIHRVPYVQKVKDPAYSFENINVSKNEISMHFEGVGEIYLRDGVYVEYSPSEHAALEWVNLYLKGQALVALLHQRRIITFHASSFIHSGRGVMILGESGAGKSSLTASFALKGAGFLSDDITPVIFNGSEPQIWSLQRAIRIRRNTALQLNIETDKLREAEAGTEKQYLQVDDAGIKNFPMHTILKIEIGEVIKPEFRELSHAEKFSLLRSEICMWEILAGMPETEADYLQQLLNIIRQVHFVRLIRPAEIEISLLRGAVIDYLGIKHRKVDAEK
jgi:hypothetical protein